MNASLFAFFCCVQGHWPYSASEDQQTIRSAPASFGRLSFDYLESIQQSSWPRWAQCRPKTLIKSTIAFRRNFRIPNNLLKVNFTITKLHLSPVLILLLSSVGQYKQEYTQQLIPVVNTCVQFASASVMWKKLNFKRIRILRIHQNMLSFSNPSHVSKSFIIYICSLKITLELYKYFSKISVLMTC